MDIKELAKTLGLSVTAVRDRCQKLGIVPDTISQSRGRPKQFFSNEQCEQIASFGLTEPDPEIADQWVESADQAASGAIVAARNATAGAIQRTLSSFDQQCNMIEQQAGQAIAARAAAIPSRSFQVAAQILESTPMGVDFAGFALPISPYARAISGDRFPEAID